jgi:outer membrane protein assembly factor BamB
MQRIPLVRLAGLLCTILFCLTCGDGTGPSTDPVASVRISPAVDTITAITGTVRLVAVALAASGDTLRGKSFTWTTSQEYVVSVQNGVATANAPGSATITATSEGKSAQCTIWVIQELASIRVSSEQQRVYMLELPFFVWADPLDAGGYWVPEVQFTWSSSDESVATVIGDQYGGASVTPKADGTARISAAANGVEGSTTVHVAAAVRVLWEYETGGDVSSSPALGTDGTVYFGSGDRRLYAINPDGTKRWHYQTGGYILSSPAVAADGTIYVGSDDHRLYAVNPDGAGKWELMMGRPVSSSPAVAGDGTIYVGSDDGRLYAVNPDGTEKWNFLTGGGVFSSPAVGLDGTIYVGSDDGRLYAVTPGGAERWSYLIGGYVASSPAIADDGTVYVTSDDARVHAVNPDGSVKWSYLQGGYQMRSSPVIAPDGTVYVGTGGPEFLALNPDGTLKWAYAMEYGMLWAGAAAVAADGTVYVGFVDAPFTALTADGTPLWEARLGSWTLSSPAIAPDGTVYVGSIMGLVYAVVPVEGAAANGGLAASAWPRFRHDARNTGNVATP